MLIYLYCHVVVNSYTSYFVSSFKFIFNREIRTENVALQSNVCTSHICVQSTMQQCCGCANFQTGEIIDEVCVGIFEAVS